MDADVIIIGAGLAGIMSAHAACEQGARVLLLSRKAVGLAGNSAISNGIFAGPTRDYPPDAYVRETIAIGAGLNSRSHVETVAREIGPVIDRLRAAGCAVAERRDHYMVPPERPDRIPGMTLMQRMAASVKGLPGLTVRTGFHVLDIVTREGRVQGVTGIDKQGRGRVLCAPAVILACGGAGALYRRNDNQKRAWGQGYAMALRAGLELRDMEFVQFYPFVHAQPGVTPILLYPPLPTNARLIDESGQDVATRWGLGNLNALILKKRDELSALIHKEMEKGPIYMDYRDVPPAEWERPPLAMLQKLRFDFRSKPFAVAPAVHFCMGGIPTAPDAQTALPGLFACGEVAWGLHGANRRGGNALSECLVFGQMAGTRAASWGLSNPLPDATTGEAPPDPPRSDNEAENSRLRALGKDLREVAWRHAGIVRHAEGMEKGMERLGQIQSDLNATTPTTLDGTIKRWDLLGGCLVLRTILATGIARRESLGSFKRRDFADTPAQSRFGNSAARCDGANGRIAVTFVNPDTVEDQITT
ncbi:FAD-dependent oxidoreductase [Desulfatitalea alkaliphila]|uniref:FAD-dependent oxidoreductase n=1 Tax=Desulfatitalea alkaliphila TaxID=2929485 RepID=A0AA41UL39_9BACT|nr:FAD-dependent oxidoreductase [Desulfatitalea alkaliphila]MCJ8502979.1 FAD-dependent oxidoreductase [Desulfatitalea alkaliphila]